MQPASRQDSSAWYLPDMRCDLHVHSFYSGMCTVPGLRRFCRECYSPPDEVYRILKTRGMDLVTLTDHDSIEGAEPLRRHPDFFLSEEVTCEMPHGTEVHVGVYGMEERHHDQLQTRRSDLPRLLAYLYEQDLFFSINHAFSSLTGRRRAEDFDWLAHHFPACEVRNGQLPATNNRRAEEWAHRLGKLYTAGSDGHSLRSLGKTGTIVAHARTKEEFLRGLRSGAATVFGEHGNPGKLSMEILAVTVGMVLDSPGSAIFTPLALLTPVFGMCNFLWELGFAHYWGKRLQLGSTKTILRAQKQPPLP